MPFTEFPKRSLQKKKVSSELEQLITERTSFILKPGQIKRCEIADGVDKYSAGVVMPIISEGDPIGSVVLLDDGASEMREVDEKLAESAAGFLGKQMEI